MKVFYTTSASFKQDFADTFFKKTVNYLRFKIGQKNLKVNNYTPNFTEVAKESELLRKMKENEKAIKTSDVVVADMTQSSGNLGYQVALAVAEHKAILILRNKNDKQLESHNPLNTPAVNKNIVYKEYSSEEDITKHVDQFLEAAKAKIDTKFILIIPAEIDRYLNWVSDFRRMHKAQVVRQALEKEMSRDKDWKDTLKQESYSAQG